jgi:hypothetical protein
MAPHREDAVVCMRSVPRLGLDRYEEESSVAEDGFRGKEGFLR